MVVWLARGSIKSTDEVISQILNNTLLPIKKHALLRRIGGVGWTRFDDILDYMMRENHIDVVKIGSEDHILKRNGGFGSGVVHES